MECKKIKLLLVFPFFYPHKGGSERYAEEIYAKIIKKHDLFEVDVLCYDTDNTKVLTAEYRGMTIYRIPCYNIIQDRFVLPKPLALFKILNKLEKNAYNFVNTHIRFFDPTWWLWRYARKIGAKSFYTEHVPSHPQHKNPLIKWFSIIVDETIARVSLKKYDFITAVNQASAIYLENHYKLTQSINLVRIGTDINKFKPNKNLEEFKIPNSNIKIIKGTILITYLGRLLETKGINILYEVAKRISSTNKNVVFVFAGPGELEKELRNRVNLENFKDKIIVTGNLDYESAANLLNRTDIFVNPSHHNEGLPTTIIEAGGAECAVIATDNGGTNEIIINRKTGYLIEQKSELKLEKTIQEAIANPTDRILYAKALREKVENEYNWDKNAEILYELLCNL